MDDDFGVVKEEIVEEEQPLPCFNGRVVSWLVSAGASGLRPQPQSQPQTHNSTSTSHLNFSLNLNLNNYEKT